MSSRPLIACLSACVLAFGAAACGDDDEETTTGGNAPAAPAPEESGTDFSSLSGSIRIDGSSTVQPIAEAASELIGEEASGLRVTVGGAGTGDGFERFCRGEIVIADASRRIEKGEFDDCAEQNVEPVEVEIALDGLSVIANPSLEIPNDCITTAQLKRLLAPNSKVTNYSQLGSGFPDTEFSAFTPGTESGTFDYFTDEVLETDAEQRTSKVQTSADDNQLITGISGTEGAIGYVGFAFADKNKDKVKTLQVDGGDGCVAPTPETINNGTYKPLSRSLYMYPSLEAAARPEVKGFIQFVLENPEEVVAGADYIPLPEDRIKASQDLINAPKVVDDSDLE